MKTRLHILALLSFALLGLTACDVSDKNPLFQKTEVAAGVVAQDSVQMPDGSLAVVTPEMRTVVDPAKIIPAGTKLTETQVHVRPEVQAAVSAVKVLPIPFADVASLALNGILAIAAMWMGSKKKTAEKIAASAVQGVDTFRDILDQTPGGQSLDAKLTSALRTHQESLKVLDAATELVRRYETPSKPAAAESAIPIEQIVAEWKALKAQGSNAK